MSVLRLVCRDLQKLRIVAFGISSGGSLTGPLRRPPILPLHEGTPYRGYAYDVGVWDLSIARGPFSVAPCQILVTIRNLFIAVRPWDLLWRPSHAG